MTWEQIFEKYINYSGEESVIEYLKQNYHAPLPRHNGFLLNPNKCTVVHNGKEIKLQKKTFKMLNYIYENRPRIVTREEIYDNVWEDVIVEERTIDVHIRKIRKEIPQIPIQTFKKLGLIWTKN